MKGKKLCIMIALSVWMSFVGVQTSFGACENGVDCVDAPPAFNVSGAEVTTVDVNTANTINTNVLVGGSGGASGPNKFGTFLPGPYYGPMPTGPEIPLPVSGVANYNTADKIIAGFPSFVTRDMMDEYVLNKTFFVKDQKKKEKLAKKFHEAREKLTETANVVIFRKFKPTNAIYLSLGFPDKNVMFEGRDYLKMGGMTLHTKEEIIKWYEWYKGEKLGEVSSQDLMAMFILYGMDIGANMAIPIGQGFETTFATEAGGVSLGSLLTAGLDVIGEHALPVGGSVGAGTGFSKGNNVVNAAPFLGVAYLAVKNPNVAKAPPPVVESKEEIEVTKEIKKDNYLELVKCALPVADPNGGLRLLVAQESLEQYLASGKNDAKALDTFHLHLKQAIRDNIKGERLKIAQEGICLVWLERAGLLKRAKDKGLVSEAEFYEKYYNNLKNAENAMRQYKIRVVGSPEDYLLRLRAINSK